MLINLLIVSQLFCIKADNSSNNDTACNNIEAILINDHQIYSFDSTQHHLPCLAHVLNLAIIALMSEITRVEHIATTSAIWEFDPTLPHNRILNGSLNVVAIVHTLTIKIQASGQRITCFERIKKECGIVIPLVIPLQNNMRWGTADGMLAQSYQLRQV